MPVLRPDANAPLQADSSIDFRELRHAPTCAEPVTPDSPGWFLNMERHTANEHAVT